MNNKIIVHYRRTGGEIQVKDIVIERDAELEYVDENDNLLKVRADESKGKRATLPLNFKQAKFNNDMVKAGYAFVMPKDPKKGTQIKLPKKEIELRELFGLNDPKKASYWTDEYDNFDIQTVKSDKDKLSFLRGLLSAQARIIPGAKGYISWCWEKLGQNDYLLDEIFQCNSSAKCNMEYNGG